MSLSLVMVVLVAFVVKVRVFDRGGVVLVRVVFILELVAVVATAAFLLQLLLEVLVI